MRVYICKGGEFVEVGGVACGISEFPSYQFSFIVRFLVIGVEITRWQSNLSTYKNP
jgi:hypothetical protein